MQLHQTKNSGFTLVELMVTMSIVAILAAIAYGYFGNINKNSRDQQRLRDLNSIKQALELYKQQNHTYPPQSGIGSYPSVLIPAYLAVVPTSGPSQDSDSYTYSYDPSLDIYSICAKREGNNNYDVVTSCNSPAVCHNSSSLCVSSQ